MISNETFFDTDCISSFLWVRRENIIINLFTGQIILPKQVYNELDHPSIPHISQRIKNMEQSNSILIKEIEIDSEAYKIYHELAIQPPPGILKIGKGEAAAIALAKVNNGILASNNLKDIIYYVKKYNLKYITTGDILVQALSKKLITEEEGNDIWLKMIARKRKLPTPTFSDYLKVHA